MRITLIVVAAAASMASASQAAERVVLHPGDDIQAAVDAQPAGTTFSLTAGVYRIQSVIPKAGDAFIGEPGAVLNGSKLLETFARDGDAYVAAGQKVDPATNVTGVCRKERPRCNRPQDVYFDGVPLRAVARREDLAAGAFYFDYPGKAVYFADDPAGHVVELSYRPFAFGGAAADVTIRGLVIENYASTNQQGAIGDHGQGRGWKVSGAEIRWNHGVGVVGGAASRITSNNIHHNGELGVGGGGNDGALVRGNEIAFNSWNGVACDWECGGAKWGNVTNLVVAGNSVHDNLGPGLWTDIDCSDILYEDNDIARNLGAGISHEISGSAVIRDNHFQANGADSFIWGWSGQVQIQNSTNVRVYRNILVLDPAKGGNGIMIIQQDRGGRHMPRDNWVHDNDVTMAGGAGAVAGWFADYKPGLFGDANNRFDRNHYHLGALAEGQDVFAPNRWVSFRKWRATGQDINATLDSDVGS